MVDFVDGFRPDEEDQEELELYLQHDGPEGVLSVGILGLPEPLPPDTIIIASHALFQALQQLPPLPDEEDLD